MKTNIITVIVGIVIVVIGYMLLEKSGRTVTKEKYELAENLCLSSDKTIGFIEEEYTELVIKGISMFTYTYKYTVSGSDYYAETMVSTEAEDIETVAEIWYNKNVPSIFILEDPCEKKLDYDNNMTIGNERMYFWSGLLIAGFGLLFTLGAVVNFFKSLFKS